MCILAVQRKRNSYNYLSLAFPCMQTARWHGIEHCLRHEIVSQCLWEGYYHGNLYRGFSLCFVVFDRKHNESKISRWGPYYLVKSSVMLDHQVANRGALLPEGDSSNYNATSRQAFCLVLLCFSNTSVPFMEIRSQILRWSRALGVALP